MKRLWLVAIVSLALPLFAQIHGVPASVTSFGAGRGSTPGAAASVTSLGPYGYSNGPKFSQPYYHNRNYGNSNYNTMCSTPGALIPSAMGCTSTYFTNSIYGLPANAGPTNLRPRGRGRNGAAVYPVYVPYAVPVVVEPEGAAPDAQAMAEDEASEPPALTVFERRPKVATPPTSAAPIDESRVYHPAPNQASTPAPSERQEPAIVLVYKDGHQRDVQNYAIMGNYLYDIGTFVAQKVPLAELDLKATLKANNDRGVDFTLPAGVTP